MTTFRIAIVAHVDRTAEAIALDDKVESLGVSFDDGELGCEGNHRKVWDWHTTAGPCHDWAVVLEDDALPVDEFREQLSAALDVAPAPIVSLYLGTGYPPHWQNRIQSVLAHTSAHWLLCSSLLHAVGVAIRTDLLPELAIPEGLPIDNAISNWAKAHGHLVAYSVPSLVDHADTTPLVPLNGHNRRERTEPRHAHRIGTRPLWTPRIAAL